MNAQSGKAATTHTPTPWFATDLRQVRSHVGFVALTSGSDFNVAIEEANAAFIVRACNSHNALVAAVTGAENWLSEYEAGPDSGLHGLLDQLRAALAAAGEGP